MPKNKEEYVRDIMDVWVMNKYDVQTANKNSFELADKMTGFGNKDEKLVDAMQEAIDTAQSPFELTWGEAISAFVTGLFSLNSSVQAERLNIVAAKIADVIVPAVAKYEVEKRQALEAKQQSGSLSQQNQQVNEQELQEVNGKKVYGPHTAKALGVPQAQSQGQNHGL